MRDLKCGRTLLLILLDYLIDIQTLHMENAIGNCEFYSFSNLFLHSVFVSSAKVSQGKMLIFSTKSIMMIFNLEKRVPGLYQLFYSMIKDKFNK